LNVSVVVLAAVLLLIAIRQVGNLKIQIWQAMLLGAVAVLVSGEITLTVALRAIDIDVMLFLFGMFVVGRALEESGYLAHLSYKYFRRAKSIDALMLYVLFGAGLASTILMNDTLAVIGTPVVLLLARKHDMSPKLLLLALCFGVTIGSVTSPIGNPQNLLIALGSNMANPFVTFLVWLLVPTIANLLLTFVVLKHSYAGDFHDAELSHSQEPIHNRELALRAKISLATIITLVIVKILIVTLGVRIEFRLTYIALAAALPILLGSRLRWRIVRRIDWSTLVFFAAMFVLMRSVWDSGFVQSMLQRTHFAIDTPPAILGISAVVSQFISNVPLVALYQPLLLHAGAGTPALIALAAGSTIAGNLSIIGAASNVIVIQNAEQRSHHTISYWEFARVGVPLTVVNLAVYYAYFALLGWLIAVL
jgi:Na+/H+ antiporter NhaD/arsenite permease-like protein